MAPASREGAGRSIHAVSCADPTDRDDPGCAGQLTSADAALAVVLDASPRSWLAARDGSPAVDFVSTYPHPDCYRTFSDPADTTRIALAVDDWLASLSESATPAVCLDSIDTLAEYTDRVEAARFLEVLVGRVRAADGIVHCHGDSDGDAMPAAHCLVAAADERDTTDW